MRLIRHHLPALLLHLLGSARRISARLLSIVTISGVGLGIFVGGLSAIDSVRDSRDHWQSAGHLADLELRVGAEDVANFPALSDLTGVADHRLRLMMPAAMRLADGRPLRALVIASASGSRAPINVLTVTDGRGLSTDDPNGIVIERALARHHGVRVGDAVEIQIGDDWLPLRVRGIATDPEFLLAPANPLLFIPTPASLGVLYLNPAVLTARFGFMPANSALIRLSDRAPVDAVRAALRDRAGTRLVVESVTARQERFDHQFLDKDLRGFALTMPVIVLFCAFASAMVTGFLFIHWVAGERQAIGVFLVLGHPPGGIAGTFALLFGGLALAVTLTGLLLAPLIGRAFLLRFCSAIGLPLPDFTFSADWVCAGIVGVLGLFALSGGIALRQVFRLSPRDAMRRAFAPAHAPGRISHALGRLLPWAWLRLPLRGMLRYPTVSAIAIVSIALGAGLATAFPIAHRAFVDTATAMVSSNTWDCALDFVAPVWRDEADRIASAVGADVHQPYLRAIVEARHQGRRASLQAIGYDPGDRGLAVRLLSGRDLDPDDPDGILLERDTARALGVGVGERLSITMQNRQRMVVVRGLMSTPTPGEARLPLTLLQALTDLDGRASGLFLSAPGRQATVAAIASTLPDAAAVLTREEAARTVLEVNGQISTVIGLGQLLSVGIAALCVFASVGYTVTLRRDEYQTLRVLGYRDRLIAAMVFVEITMIGLTSLVLAVPVATLAAAYCVAQLSIAWFDITFAATPMDYVRVLLPTLGLLWLVTVPATRIVLRTPIESGLRAEAIQ